MLASIESNQLDSLKTITSVQEIQAFVAAAKTAGKTVGFVPTMGALHRGHLSLVSQALAECDVVVVSVFVNPTQFNEQQDFKNYPRTAHEDVSLLKSTGCHAVFMPEFSEVYPVPDNTPYDFGRVETLFEGAQRPGHFKGVGMVVRRLLNIVTPTKAYFGLKDFQQVMVIRSLVKQYNIEVEIVAAPTIREDDGLAMSSRNQLLSDEQRKQAPEIYRTLQNIKKRARSATVAQLVSFAQDEINSNPELELEYLGIADPENLEPITDLQTAQHAIALIAVRTGAVRLIDNLHLF